MLTSQDISHALNELGIQAGDSLLTHSSLKSLGSLQESAKTVVDGMRLAVGEEGTIIFPTLCQRDWEHVYENWHMNADSDVGYLTNYFRKLPGALRSNQATHSVAAVGPKAVWLTETHGQSGLRYGIFGDTCFSADSPWEKMYQLNTKMLFIGVTLLYCTMKHLAEYRFMEEQISRARQKPDGDVLIARVWHYSSWKTRGVWPLIDSLYMQDQLERAGKLRRTRCGNAELLLVSAADYVDMAQQLMDRRDERIFAVGGVLDEGRPMLQWLKDVNA